MPGILKPEHIVELIAVTAGLTGIVMILKSNWKWYGVLYLLSSASAASVCYLFVTLDFYSFKAKLTEVLPIPIIEMLTVIPFLSLLGVKYSPEKWIWKIPFYAVLVHIAITLETTVLHRPVQIIDFKISWDLWDSYTAWWIYLLFFEGIGGKIVPASSRTPINSSSFRYGQWAWIILHVVMLTTIFLAGVYLGRLLSR
ncbi:CBO0543 family protein [Mesobacillus harenae]|uniref:CBO0543 family protein n=1 Tax=Mesobacillus harenae TaxID=2213203 RepID=UPI001580C7DD|nr:CBO0543 family protein [Mesobacillus harenae]